MKEAFDCILVLCHFLEKNGTIVDEFRSRLEEAAKVQKSNPHLCIMVNGGTTVGRPISQGKAAYEFLHARGVPDDRIIWGNEGHDTLEELQLAREIMRRYHWSCPLVVTNRLQQMQVSVAFWRRGVHHKKLITPFQLKGSWNVAIRFLVLPFIFFDPDGSGWIFRLSRHFRSGGSE